MDYYLPSFVFKISTYIRTHTHTHCTVVKYKLRHRKCFSLCVTWKVNLILTVHLFGIKFQFKLSSYFWLLLFLLLLLCWLNVQMSNRAHALFSFEFRPNWMHQNILMGFFSSINVMNCILYLILHHRERQEEEKNEQDWQWE